MMKSSLLTFIISASAIFVAPCQSATVEDFSISVKPVSSTVYLEKSLLVEIKVVYKGNDILDVAPLEKRYLAPSWRNLMFQTPVGWKVRKGSTVVQSGGVVLSQKLVKNDVMKETVDLKDYFQSIRAGKTTLPVSLKIWPEGGSAKDPIILKTELRIEIQKKSQKKSPG